MPDSNCRSARCLAFWDMSPCIAAAFTPWRASFVTSRSAPRLVRTKTRVEYDPRRCSTSVSTFVSVVTGDEVVLDLAGILGQRVAFEARRAVRVRARELADLAVERGREEHRLAVAGQAADELVDLGLEAHVEHPVGLVEDEDADPAAGRRAGAGRDPRAGRASRRACGPASRAWPERSDGMPPYTAATVRPLALRERLDARAVTWTASSRVGRGRAPTGRPPSRAVRSAIGDRERERLARAGRRPREDVEPRERVREHELLDSEGRSRSCELRARRRQGCDTPSSRKDCWTCVRLLYGFETCNLETPEGGTRSESHRAARLPTRGHTVAVGPDLAGGIGAGPCAARLDMSVSGESAAPSGFKLRQQTFRKARAVAKLWRRSTRRATDDGEAEPRASRGSGSRRRRRARRRSRRTGA